MADEGTVYLGYPVLATAEETVEVDALMVSQAHGLVAFLLPESVPQDGAGWAEAQARQDRLYDVLDSTLVGGTRPAPSSAHQGRLPDP
ncbi:hypothetical protein [Streptomyces sp. NPDC056549]|uniref:hypothetical protein n=1 Tax=Streptomyces sp. NPDC056549 TaxID=3345864 RepID=UPI0036BA26BE